jgi:hypothetical protein
MMLSEQGADFFSQEVDGAESKEGWECPREGLWERDVTYEDVEFDSIHVSGVGRFSNDADFVVARAESLDASLPASVGEFLDLSDRGI